MLDGKELGNLQERAESGSTQDLPKMLHQHWDGSLQVRYKGRDISSSPSITSFALNPSRSAFTSKRTPTKPVSLQACKYGFRLLFSKRTISRSTCGGSYWVLPLLWYQNYSIPAGTCQMTYLFDRSCPRDRSGGARQRCSTLCWLFASSPRQG
jgi:hypothetical protein